MKWLFVLILAAPSLAIPAARAETTCSFGSPTPGFRAVRVDLPKGSSFLTTRFTSVRPTMPAGDRSSWHLAEGVAVINASTGALVTWRVASYGSSPRRAVVESSGMQVARQEFTGPDAPFVHQVTAPVPSLAPGSYYLVGFGTDGDRRLPNPWWGAEVHLAENVPCTPVGSGETFDYDQTDFSGGTQVAAWGAGIAQDEHLSFHLARHLVFGLMDVATQVAGSAKLDYEIPGAKASATQITAFASTDGDYSFTANFAGIFPVTVIAGIALDIP